MNRDTSEKFLATYGIAMRNYEDAIANWPRCVVGRDEVRGMTAELGTAESLKACPFCGGKAETHRELNVVPEFDPRTGAYISADMYYYEHTGCPTCDIWFDICEDEPEGTTIKMWNRRAK